MHRTIALALTVLLSLASRPAFASGDHEVLIRGGDGALWVVDATGRSTSVGGALVGMPGGAGGGGRLDVVVRGTDDALWAVTRAGATWSAFEPVGGALSGAPSAVARGAGLDVVARGSDGACWHVRRDASGWGAWASLGGSFPEGATFGLASRDDASLDVFARGMEGHLWHSQLRPAGWSGFAPLGEGRQLGSDPAACAAGPDRIDVVALAPDLSAQTLTWESASGWSGWSSLGATFREGTSLGVASPAPGRLVVAGIGTDGAIWTNAKDGGSWGAWAPLGDARSTSSPVLVHADLPPAPGEGVPSTKGGATSDVPGIRVAPDLGAPVISVLNLSNLTPLDVIRLDRPVPSVPADQAISLTPEMLLRLGHASSAPFPGCDPEQPCVRVTLLGFRLEGDTADPASDGPGDEISVRADAWYSADGRWDGAEPFARETKPHGSRAAGAAGAAARRVRAGSASADGGMRRGDQHPARLTSSPAAVAPGELPLVLFEGPIAGRAQLRMAISAWEVDGGEGPRACCPNWNLQVAESVWGGRTGSGSGYALVTTPAAEFERRDRPFGVLGRGPTGSGSADDVTALHVLAGPLADWRALAARSGLNGPGVLALDHADFQGNARCVTLVRVEILE